MGPKTLIKEPYMLRPRYDKKPGFGILSSCVKEFEDGRVELWLNNVLASWMENGIVYHNDRCTNYKKFKEGQRTLDGNDKRAAKRYQEEFERQFGYDR